MRHAYGDADGNADSRGYSDGDADRYTFGYADVHTRRYTWAVDASHRLSPIGVWSGCG